MLRPDISFLENMHSLLMWKWTCCRLQDTETHTHIHTSPLFWAFVHFLPVILTNLGLSIELSIKYAQGH